MRRALPILLLTAFLTALPHGAAAVTVSGPHEEMEQSFTTTQPNTPAGFTFDARYHAAGDPNANPPYMRKMIFYDPPGLRRDTSVPDRCTASDAELALRGPDACPPGSRLGGGETETAFMGQFPSTVQLDLFNNADEQIIVARSPLVASVARGKIRDGSIEFASPTCYPAVSSAGPCPVDNVLQLASHMDGAAYTRESGGEVRSYLTTPPDCPASGQWETPVHLWWADGTDETVVTVQPCTAPPTG